MSLKECWCHDFWDSELTLSNCMCQGRSAEANKDSAGQEDPPPPNSFAEPECAVTCLEESATDPCP